MTGCALSRGEAGTPGGEQAWYRPRRELFSRNASNRGSPEAAAILLMGDLSVAVPRTGSGRAESDPCR